MRLPFRKRETTHRADRASGGTPPDGRRFGAFTLVLVVGLTGAIVAGLAVEDPDDGSLIGIAVAHALLTLLLLLWREDTSRNPRATREALVKVLVLFVPVTGVVVVTFALTPGLARRLFRPPPLAQSGFDFGGDLRPGDVAELALSSEVAFRARFLRGPIPPNERLYWRGSVYARSEGLQWRVGLVPRSEASDVKSLAVPGADESRLVHEVVVEPRPSRVVFALDWAYAARTSHETGEGGGEGNTATGSGFPFGPAAGVPLTRDGRPRRIERLPGNTLLPSFESALRRAVATIESSEAPVVALTRAERGAYLQVPFETPVTIEPVVEEMARRKGDFEELRAYLEGWFVAKHFSYTLKPGLIPDGPASDRLLTFLLETREGYCEHYAGALATMLRMAGIPSRVVVGYQGGVRNEALSTVTVRDAESHAWVEAFDESDSRWRRLDATSWIAPDRLERGRELPAFATSGSWTRSGFRALGTALEPLRTLWAFAASGFRDQRGFDVLAAFARSLWREERPRILAWTVGSAMLALLSFAIARRRSFSRGARADDALAFRYREAMARAFARGPSGVAAPEGWEPAFAMAERLARARPEAAEPAQAAAGALSELLYGSVGAERAKELRKAVKRSLAALGKVKAPPKGRGR